MTFTNILENLMHLEESKHIKELSKSNSESFRWLHDVYHEKVYFFSINLVKDAKVAEEITNDVFVQIWKKREKLDKSLPLGGLLFKITRDFVISYFRKISKSAEQRQKYLSNYTNALWENPIEDSIFEKEYVDVAKKAIDQLPPKCKEAFLLKYEKDLKVKEIAAELDISPNTVKVHLNKASHTIRNFLDENTDLTFVVPFLLLARIF